MKEKSTIVFDCEVYSNYFLVMFRNVDNGKTLYFEQFEGQPFEGGRVMRILTSYRMISFNGNGFDVPLLALACKGATNAAIKAGCDAIILNNVRYWQFEKQFNVRMPKMDHIDLIEVAPGIASLKIYGGRLHCRRMQDLPIEPSSLIAEDQREPIRSYCGNDLLTTIDLYNSLKPQIDLRARMSEEYGIELRSKSDAQVAEAVIKSSVGKLLGHDIERPTVEFGTVFNYRTPRYIQYATPKMRDTLAMVQCAKFKVSAAGKVDMPPELKTAEIRIGQSTYKMGIGGLHSTESTIAHFADKDTILVDRDVASYYPAIILQGLYPKHMGEPFLKVYRGIVERRLAAKRKGEKVTADSLKITINGSFGKFGSKWSALYSPDLLIQTTITGQLSLLMLIEALEESRISVVSANTDGLVIKCTRSREADMDRIVGEWERATGFETEATRYAALYSRDVNNYIALKEDEKGYKSKGAYTPAGLQKNPTNEICTEAVVALLRHSTPIEKTIGASTDIRKFVTIRQVKGGAHKNSVFLGKAVRWYYAKGVEGVIQYRLNGYTVARSEGARPLMELPDAIPDDIDRDWYVREALSILDDIGYCDLI